MQIPTAREQAVADLALLRAAIGLALSEMSGITLGYRLLRDTVDRLCDLTEELQDGKIDLIKAEDAAVLLSDAKTIEQQFSSTFLPGGPGFPTTARMYMAHAMCVKAEISLRILARSRRGWWSRREHVNSHSVSYLRQLSFYILTMAQSGPFERP